MQAFVVVVPAAEVELAVDQLFELGVAAVEERASDVAGHVELWTEVGDADESIAAAAASLAPSWLWHTSLVDASVADSWRRFAAPTWVTSDVVVVPAWLGESFDPGPAAAIVIDPGAAFGMGDHPTTQLTLRLLLDELGARETPSVLDVGCGSGILAIAAALHGAGRVVAIDIATAAIEATRANAATNGVAAKVVATTTPIAEVDGAFEIIVANVLAPALIEMAADLSRLVAADGVVVISGILAGRYRHVVDALAPRQPVATATDDGWAAVTLAATGRSVTPAPVWRGCAP